MTPHLSVVFESKLVLRFTLPGTRYRGSHGTGNAQAQLEQKGEHEDGYHLETTAENASETVRVLRALAAEIERVAASTTSLRRAPYPER